MVRREGLMRTIQDAERRRAYDRGAAEYRRRNAPRPRFVSMPSLQCPYEDGTPEADWWGAGYEAASRGLAQ